MREAWIEDEVILACALVSRNEWKGLRSHQTEAKQLSELLRAGPFHPGAAVDSSFRSPDSVQRKTFDIATRHPDYRGKPTRGSKLDKVVLDKFRAEPAHMHEVAAAIRDAVASGDVKSVLDEEIEASEMMAGEGRLLLTRHLVRERNPQLRRAKLDDATGHGSPPACEVCGFDFKSVYGAVGEGYIEVHHRLPLHVSGPTLSMLSDLALLCSNCHRMIHRADSWTTPEDLRDQIERLAESAKASWDSGE